jgi:hypothetical protein
MPQENASAARIAVAAATGCCAIATAYSLIHFLEVIFWPAPDPRTVLVLKNIAFYWRGVLSLFVGVLVTVAALALQRRTPGALDRRLPLIGVVTIVITVSQGLFVP